MTIDSKIALAISGFFISAIFGWAVPLLWLLYVAGLIFLFVGPTKKKPARITVAQASAIMAGSNSDDPRQRIEEMIRAEHDEKIKEGMKRALAVMDTSAPDTHTASSVTLQQPLPAVSEEEQAAQKARQELNNVNVILYTASFLLVGAAAAFIAVSQGVAPLAKFVLLLLVATAFYAAGLLLHTQSNRLRPAATAFVGTGLALIPFVGLAGYYFVLPNGPLMWWLTSLIGLVAFLIAVSRIQTNIMGYLLLAFVFSLATSSVSVLNAPFIWYFVSVIVTGSVLTYLSYKRPQWLPQSFVAPLEQNAQLAVPVALIGAVVLVDKLNTWDYSLLTGVATLHYLVNSLGFATDKTRVAQWSAARALLVTFAATLAYAISADWNIVGVVLAVSAVAAHLYSIGKAHLPHETGWLWVAQGLLAAAALLWLDSMVAVSILLVALLIISANQLRVMKRVEYAFAGVIAGLLLPLATLRGVIEPAVDFEYIGSILLVAAASLIVLRRLFKHRHAAIQTAVTMAYITVIAEAVLVSIFSLDGAWIASILIAAAGLLYAASYVERQPSIAAVSNSILVCGTILAYVQVLDEFTWVPVASALTLGAGWYVTRWLLVSPKFISQSNVVHADIQMVSSIAIILAGGLFAMFQLPETVVAGTLLGTVGAAMLAYEGYVRGARFMYEIALLVLTFCLQRMFGHLYPDAHFLVYTHWWALVAGLTALLYVGRTGDRASGKTRGVIALCLLSIPTGLYALGDPDSFQWLFLAEHVLLAVAGVTLNNRLLVLWGSIGIGLAVLWLLKSYTYALLALIALGLIGLAIWRLMKKQQ